MFWRLDILEFGGHGGKWGQGCGHFLETPLLHYNAKIARRDALTKKSDFLIVIKKV